MHLKNLLLLLKNDYYTTMIATLSIVRYPKWMSWAGFLSMAIFRLPLWLNSSILFWKLMGCGKGGSFSKTPDLQQWALLTIWENLPINIDSNHSSTQLIAQVNAANIYGKFISGWWKLMGAEIYTLLLEPIEGHGYWDGKQPFGQLTKSNDYNGKICVLTRATIRLSKLPHFWNNVESVANNMASSKGFIGSVGIEQATFSVWESKDDMKNFAYKLHEHTKVIAKTRKEKWYSEDLFVRFKPLASYGSLNGIDLFKP